jgi:hypothetical protein
VDSDPRRLADPDPSIGARISTEQAPCGSAEAPDPRILMYIQILQLYNPFETKWLSPRPKCCPLKEQNDNLEAPKDKKLKIEPDTPPLSAPASQPDEMLQAVCAHPDSPDTESCTQLPDPPTLPIHHEQKSIVNRVPRDAGGLFQIY